MTAPVPPSWRRLPGVFSSLVAVLLSSAPCPASAQAVASSRIPFLEGLPLAEVLQKAKAEKKPVFLDVFATWCGPCKLMDRTTFVDPSVVTWSKRVVPARVDAERGEGRRIAARYSVTGFPTFLILDGDGNEIDRISGYFTASQFLPAAEAVLRGDTQYQQIDKTLKTRWDVGLASQLVENAARRNDRARVRRWTRVMADKGETFSEGAALDALTFRVVVEDYNGALEAETSDLLASAIQSLGTHPKKVDLAVFLLRDYARTGDLAAIEALVKDLGSQLERAPGTAAEMYGALGKAQLKAGKRTEGLANLEKAVKQTERPGVPGYVRVARLMDQAEGLVSAGKLEDAKSSISRAVAMTPADVGAQVKAARILSKAAGGIKDALGYAKSAVDGSLGEDHEAQDVYASLLLKSGDKAGAQRAWKVAARYEPANASYKKSLGKL